MTNEEKVITLTEVIDYIILTSKGIDYAEDLLRKVLEIKMDIQADTDAPR